MSPSEYFSVATTGNRISIHRAFHTKDLRKFLAAAHNLVSNLGFKDIELDFSNCTATYSGPMLGLAAYAERYLVNGVDVDLVLPASRTLAKILLDINGAHLI